ncbi:MAG: prepilin-type N-terminal cleavage/methylation domain-containing protein [Armatimonadota bacterium]
MGKNENKKGASLIELMIALAILAVGFLMILGVFPVSMKSVKHGKDMLFATHVAQQKMEQAIYNDFDDYGLSLASGTATLTSIVNDANTTTEFTYSVTFTPDTQAAVVSATTKNIVVIVYVTSRPERYVKIETDVAREE